MGEQLLLHSPTLDSVIMVEKTIKKYNGEYGKYQLWKKLPRKMMYQTFQVVLYYLIESNKIIVDKKEKLVWIWDPEGVKKILQERLVIK